MKLSVLQWNVWFKESADKVVQFIRETDADIVCLQELTQDSVPNPNRDIPAEIKALGYSAAYLPAHQRTGERHIKMGNGIFSKFPIISSRHVYVQHQDTDSQDYSKENRVYLEAKIKINDTELTIGTTHLSYIPRFAMTSEKQKEVDRLVAAIGDNQQNYLFTGDLNSIPNSYTVAKLGEFLNSAGPNFSEPSWTTKPFSYDGFEATTLDWRLDYIFTTPDLQVLSSKIIQTDYSDHLPILTEIEI